MNYSRFLSILSVASMAALSCYGCGDDSGKENEQPCGGTCTEEQTCNTQTNLCEPKSGNGCTSNNECKDGKICKDGKCDFECQYDFDCTAGKVCNTSGQCIVGCTGNDDCSDGKICKNKECVFECSENSDCTDGLVCKDHRCDKECTQDSDCADGNVCKADKCVPGCTSSSECDDGLLCMQGKCRPECEEDTDCSDGFCLDSACVACKGDADCSSGHCLDNECVECVGNDDCEGTLICSNNTCQPECTDNTACSDPTPFCSDEDTCVQCNVDTDCTGNNEICVSHECGLECEADIDCKDDKKCDLNDNHCYECLTKADCPSGQYCSEHACLQASDNDADADGVVDELDICPFNPNYANETEADCNYVTDADGSNVFEIWHATDLERLRAELTKTPSCHIPDDPQNLAIGDCCDDSFVSACAEGKALSCQNGMVVEDSCQYGCNGENTACATCIVTPEDGTQAAGHCCDTSFAASCAEGKLLTCDGTMIVETACALGCGEGENENACKVCNTPAEDATVLAEGDCCDAATYAQVCSTDHSTAAECIDGRVQIVTCATTCVEMSDTQVLCAADPPKAAFKIRLMNDINLADIIPADEILDVPFENLKVTWFEEVTDPETGETTTVAHDPGDDGYAEFKIKDATCVARWNQHEPIALKDVEFDGRNHRVFFKVEDKTCSLVDPFLGDIENSYIHDLTLSYNVRGLIQSTFATNIANSTVKNISVMGNVNLETRPALEEVFVGSYISDNTLKNFDPYHYSFISVGEAVNSHFDTVQYKGNITLNFTLKKNDTSWPYGKLVPGISGMFGNLVGSTVKDVSVSVSDYVYTYGRAFVPVVWTAANETTIFNANVAVPFVSGRTDDIKVASSFVSGFGFDMNNITIGGVVDSALGNVTTPGEAFFGMGYNFNNSNVLGDIRLIKGDVSATNFYGLVDSTHIQYQGIEIQSGDVNLTGGRYYGISNIFDDSIIHNDVDIRVGEVKTDGKEYYGLSSYARRSQYNNVNIKTGNLSYNEYFGLFYQAKDSAVGGKTTIETGDHTVVSKTSQGIAVNNAYYGLTKAIYPVTIGDVTIKIGDIASPGYFFGLGRDIGPNGITLTGTTTIETGNMTDMGRFYGLARRISADCSNISMKIGNVDQRKDPGNAPGSEGVLYFSGLAYTASSDEEALISNIDLTIGNITSPLYVAPLIHMCTDEKVKIDGIKVKTGDITIGGDYSSEFTRGDFDGLCRETNTTLSNIDAKYGDVYVRWNHSSVVMTRTLGPKGVIRDVKIEQDGLTAGPLAMIFELHGKLENVAVIIRHLQTSGGNYAAFEKVHENAEIKNMVYYADVYSPNPQTSGFIHKIDHANIKLENIFSAARINKYTTVDETTLKPKDAEVYHGQPALFNVVPEGAAEEIPSSGSDSLYKLALNQTKNVYWLKRHKDDFASKGYTYMSMEDREQFEPVVPGFEDMVLQKGTNAQIELGETLSGCEVIDDSCTTPWAPVDDMIVITEPRGGEISLPWMK